MPQVHALCYVPQDLHSGHMRFCFTVHCGYLVQKHWAVDRLVGIVLLSLLETLCSNAIPLVL